MKDRLPLHHNLLYEMHRQVMASLSGNASSEPGHRLDDLIRQDIDTCDLYLNLVFESSVLATWARHGGAEDTHEESLAHSPIPLAFFSTAYHGTIGFFSQELPFSLLIATLLTGFGLWIASLVYVSSPEKIAQDSSSLPSKAAIDPTLEVVGKITSMADCRWSEEGRPPSGYDNVLLGRQFMLDSGLMEITYKTGAKVVLQGPVTYNVDSKNGGFMSVGKLTGKVENKTAKGFAVRTPTATVTDLGTEFGVEVANDGTAKVTVFVGKVAFAPNRNPDHRIPLTQGQSAVMVPNSRPTMLPPADSVSYAKSFIRSIDGICPPFSTKIERKLLSTADVQRTLWYYTFNRPADNWNQMAFDDQSWAYGPAGFGTVDPKRSDIIVGTAWNTSDIWLRKKVTVRGSTEFDNAALTIQHDDGAEVYVNGELIFLEAGFNRGSALCDVTAAIKRVLKEGENLVAVHVHQTGGGQYVDLGLALNKKFTILVSSSDMGMPATWRSTTVKPAEHWMATAFDDTAWHESLAPFGTPGEVDWPIKTPWNTADIWLRKTIHLTDVPKAFRAELRIAHCEDVEVFVNGKPVFSRKGSSELFLSDISEKLATAMQRGSNTIAVHVQQKSYRQFIDLGIILFPK